MVTQVVLPLPVATHFDQLALVGLDAGGQPRAIVLEGPLVAGDAAVIRQAALLAPGVIDVVQRAPAPAVAIQG